MALHQQTSHISFLIFNTYEEMQKKYIAGISDTILKRGDWCIFFSQLWISKNKIRNPGPPTLTTLPIDLESTKKKTKNQKQNYMNDQFMIYSYGGTLTIRTSQPDL